MKSNLSKQFDFLKILKGKLYIKDDNRVDFKFNNYTISNSNILNNINSSENGINVTKNSKNKDILYLLPFELRLIFCIVDDNNKDCIFLINDDYCFRIFSFNKIKEDVNKTDIIIGAKYNKNTIISTLHYNFEMNKYYFSSVYFNNNRTQQPIYYDLYDIFSK